MANIQQESKAEELKRSKTYYSEIVVSDRTIFDNFTKKYGEAMLKNVDLFIKFTYEWVNRNIQALGSKNLGERIAFYPADENALFEMFGIDKAYVRALADLSTYIDKKWKISMEKINILMYVLIFFYYDNQELFAKSEVYKDIQPYKIANFLLSARFFSSIIIRQFRYVPDPAIMFYTLENLSNKFTITKMNSLYEMIQYMADTNIATWTENGRIKLRTDQILDNYMRKLNTRISSTLVNISRVFYENYEKDKKIVTEANTMVNDEGKTIMVNTSNISNIISSNASKIINNLYLDANVNTKYVRIASNKTSCPYSSLHNVIQEIQRKRDSDVEIIIRNTLSYFLVTEQQDPRLINSAKFFEVCIKAYKVANTNNDYIIKIKSALNGLLTKYSDVYKTSNRKNTKANFRAGLFLYLILYITNLN